MGLPTVQGTAAVLWKLVFQLRYRDGFGYLDHCGKTVNAIQRANPRWMIRSADPSPQNAPLWNIETGATFNFSTKTLDVTLEKSAGGESLSEKDIDQFGSDTDELCQVVTRELGIQDLERMGFRVWLLFPAPSMLEAENWLTKLKSFSISDAIPRAFGGNIEATTVTTTIRTKDRRYRVAFTEVERAVQVDLGKEILSVSPRQLDKDQHKILLEQMKVRKRIHENPEHAALIDIDASIDDPVSAAAADFIQSSVSAVFSGVSKLGGGFA